MKLNPRAKILIAVLLLVAAVAAWYLLYTQGQETVEASPPQPKPVPAEEAKAATSASARALEILPLPFLVTKAPEEAPPPPAAAKPEAAPPPPQEAVEAPPNPFVPLPQRQKAILASKQPAPQPRPAPASPEPVAVQPAAVPELVRVPVPKLRPPARTEPLLPPEAGIGAGALPIRLQPVEREVAAAPPQARGQEQPPARPQPQERNPLQEWAKAQDLRLSGVALGPVSVAIFATRNGYLALPVGEVFPGTEIRLQAVTAERVLLVQGPYNLTLEYGGGG